MTGTVFLKNLFPNIKLILADENNECKECQPGYYSDYLTNNKCVKCKE